MRTRDAILPDAEANSRPDLGLFRRRHAAAAQLCRDLRECARLRGARTQAAKSSAAARCIFTDSTSPKFAPSRSNPSYQRQGGGKRLVNALMEEAEKHKVTCICLFTRKPDFFAHLGFELAQREDLPDKIHKDCWVCPRLHCCDEVAMVRGELPKFAILPEPVGALVKIEA